MGYRRSLQLSLAAVIAAVGVVTGVFTSLMIGGNDAVVQAQALTPRTLRLNVGNMEEQAVSLAQQAEFLMQVGRGDRALPVAQLAVQLAPRNFLTHAVLGGVLLRQDKFADAIASLKKADSLKPDQPQVLFLLGSAHLRNKQYQESIALLLRGLSLEKEKPSPNALFDLGNAYFLTYRYDDALTRYRQLLAIDAKFWAATNNIGLVEYERGNTDTAIAQWESAIKQAEKSEYTAEPMLALASAQYAKGDKAQGIATGIAALKIDPRYGKPEYLVENLWGNRLMTSARLLLSEAPIRQLLQESAAPPPPERRVSPPARFRNRPTAPNNSPAPTPEPKPPSAPRSPQPTP
ncbi:MAG: tetratricopeptide repeat protein [Pseudanabaena sp. ELA607]